MKDSDHLKRGNLLWESSRMFLPEHKEQLLDHRRRKREYVQPELAEDRKNELDAALGEALVTGRPVILTVAGRYEPERIRGRIIRIDPHAGSLRIETADDHIRVSFRRLLHLEWERPER